MATFEGRAQVLDEQPATSLLQPAPTSQGGATELVVVAATCRLLK